MTGGAGFIGSHLVEVLTAASRRVRVFDNFSSGLRGNLAHISPPPDVAEGCLTDPAAVDRAAAGCEVVFHLGALASVAKSVEDPFGNQAVNSD